MIGIENSMIALQSQRDKNETFNKRNDNLKVITGTAITSENPKYSDTVMQNLNVLESKENYWFMKGQLNSSIEDMNLLHWTKTFAGISSPEASTMSEMTTNTGGYKNKT